MSFARKFVVLGGVGAIGRVVVRDLLASHPRNHILIADFNAPAAQAYARSLRSRRVGGCFADARDCARVLRGHTVVINCTQHDFNMRVMRAALLAGVHYVDLGGLFTWTRKQLRLHRPFQRAGLTAILGMGCAPGITNVLTRYAVEKLGGARSVKIRVGTRDFNPSPGFPYSEQTIREELTLSAWIVANGKFREVAPRTGWEQVRFPKPVGTQWVVRTRHSEVATLPVTFGLRQCDFKVGFDRAFVRDVMARRVPNHPVERGRPDDYEIARVLVDGVAFDCHARAHRRWHASAGDVDTGCPPSIVAQMIATGQVEQRGVLPPESAVPVAAFFAELRKRGMKIVEVRS